MAQGTFDCVIMGGTVQPIGGWSLTTILELLDS
jgi:hypothetical protein